MLPDFVRRIPDLDEPKLAVFDGDGTLWEHDVADGSTMWMLQRGLLLPRWDEYQRIYTGDPSAGCRFLLQLYKGMHIDRLHELVHEYWNGDGKREWIPEVVEVLLHLHARGFRIWCVTGSPTDLLLPVLDLLPVERLVGMDYELDGRGVITGNLSGISCAGDGKTEKIRSLYGSGPIQLVAGNALLDEGMLREARDVAWAVYPSPQLRTIALDLGWPILDPPGGPRVSGSKWGASPAEMAG